MYVLEFAGEDDRLARAEARTASKGCWPLAPGLAMAQSISIERARGLALTRRVSHVIGRTAPTIAAARACLANAVSVPSGSLAVRASVVRDGPAIDTEKAQTQLGSVLTDRGASIDLDNPSETLRVVFTAHRCYLGWIVLEPPRGYGSRRPTNRPFFKPGSMGPQLARVLANLAGSGPGTTIFDPFCGTGGILIEAASLGADVIAADADPAMVRGARENLQAIVPSAKLSEVQPGTHSCFVADATRMPLNAETVDAVVFDAPYGRQSAIEGSGSDALTTAALGAAATVSERAVVVTDQPLSVPKPWRRTLRHQRRVHRSLTRYLSVLEH